MGAGAALSPPNSMPLVTRFNSGYLYSARLLPASFNAGNYDYFVASTGTFGAQGFASTTQLTLTETNLANAQKLPNQQSFIVREVGVYFIAMGEAGTGTSTPLVDITNALNFSALSLNKPEYTFTFGPSVAFPGGAGVVGAVSPASGGSVTESWSSGWQTPQARFRLKQPVRINPGDTFWFRQTVTRSVNLSAACKCWVILKGDWRSQVAS